MWVVQSHPKWPKQIEPWIPMCPPQQQWMGDQDDQNAKWRPFHMNQQNKVPIGVPWGWSQFWCSNGCGTVQNGQRELWLPFCD